MERWCRFVSHYCQEAFWWFFTLGVTLALGGCLVAAWIISRRSGLIDRFTLAPRYIDAPYLDFSVKYDEEDVQAAGEQAQRRHRL